MLSEIAPAVVELGVPVAVLSWYLFHRLYGRGEIARDASSKDIGATLKAIRKSDKAAKRVSDSLLHAKWMKFGGGFYGVAAVWTLIFIEASGVVGFVAHPSKLQEIVHKGAGDFVGSLISGQITTLVSAATWFLWWPARGHGPLAWIVVAYTAYLGGLNLARYETRFGGRLVELDSRARWRSLLLFRKHQAEMSEEE